MDILHFWMDGSFRTCLAAEAAGDAEIFDDSNLHESVQENRSWLHRLTMIGN
jgi:hypothetical protein